MEKVFTVSEFITLLNIGLKRSQAKISGEVCEAKQGPTGHVYFSLKDEKDGSVISCIIWKYRYFVSGLALKEGMKIIASGAPQIYAPSGRLSFIADTIEPAGEGELKKQYEKLKKQLSEEGVFSEEKKRSLPEYIQKIGVITSLKGAVIADFSNNLKKFGFKVKIADSRVEGTAAIDDLLLAVRLFRAQDIEALVIMRGGGSLESMAALNNELLVREIAGFPVPVVAGIGHHKDQPLLALAADISVSTPTAAANLFNESWQRAALQVQLGCNRILSGYSQLLQNAEGESNRLAGRITREGERILMRHKEAENRIRLAVSLFGRSALSAKKNLAEILAKLGEDFRDILAGKHLLLDNAETTVRHNNPERQLKLGYSLIRSGGKIVKTLKDVKIGESLEAKISDGLLISILKEKKDA